MLFVLWMRPFYAFQSQTTNSSLRSAVSIWQIHFGCHHAVNGLQEWSKNIQFNPQASSISDDFASKSTTTTQCLLRVNDNDMVVLQGTIPKFSSATRPLFKVDSLSDLALVFLFISKRRIRDWKNSLRSSSSQWVFVWLVSDYRNQLNSLWFIRMVMTD